MYNLTWGSNGNNSGILDIIWGPDIIPESGDMTHFDITPESGNLRDIVPGWEEATKYASKNFIDDLPPHS
jgi:hypothetical protein